MSRPSIRAQNTKRMKCFVTKPRRYEYVYPQQLLDLNRLSETSTQPSLASQLASATKEVKLCQDASATMQAHLRRLQLENDTLRKQVSYQTARADSIFESWKSATGMTFALESRYGLGLTVEQLTGLSNAMSNTFDESTQRWVSKKIPGTGNNHVR